MPEQVLPKPALFSGRLIRHQLCLSKLVDRAAAGEEIIIAKAGKPKATLPMISTGPWRPSCRTISSRFRRTRSMAIELVPSLHATPP
jgi:antitoxin (DNA-binding transcriptional repressor) of toxin-antitoxin stability system